MCITLPRWTFTVIVLVPRRAALGAKRARGERGSGRIPYGQRLADDGRTLVPCPREAATVALALELSREGLPLRGIAARLASAGHVARSGKPFGPQSIANMLRAA